MIFKQLANLNFSLSNALLLGEKERCEEVTEELQHAKKELIEIWVHANKLDVQVQNFLTGDGKLVNSSDRGKKIVDGEMFSLEERGEGRTQEGRGCSIYRWRGRLTKKKKKAIICINCRGVWGKITPNEMFFLDKDWHSVNNAFKKVLNSGLGPAEMVLFWSFFFTQKSFFPLLWL